MLENAPDQIVCHADIECAARLVGQQVDPIVETFRSGIMDCRVKPGNDLVGRGAAR